MWTFEHAADVVVRGTIVYLFLFAAMRLMPRRTVGTLGASDLLVLVLIADAVQNAMSGGYESVSDGLLLAVVIFGWATFIDWLDYKFPRLHLSGPKEIAVVRDGHILYKALAREQMSEDELLSQLRLNGVSDVSRVRQAFLEPDGHMSVLLSAGTPRPGKRGQHVGAA